MATPPEQRLARRIAAAEFASDARTAASLNANGVLLRALLYDVLDDNDPDFLALSTGKINPAELVAALEQL